MKKKVTTTPSKTVSTAEQLEEILAGVAEPTRSSLRNSFALRNPLELMKELLPMQLPNTFVRPFMLLKISQRPAFKGEPIELLVSRAVDEMWARLAAQAAE